VLHVIGFVFHHYLCCESVLLELTFLLTHIGTKAQMSWYMQLSSDRFLQILC